MLTAGFFLVLTLVRSNIVLIVIFYPFTYNLSIDIFIFNNLIYMFKCLINGIVSHNLFQLFFRKYELNLWISIRNCFFFFYFSGSCKFSETVWLPTYYNAWVISNFTYCIIASIELYDQYVSIGCLRLVSTIKL